MIQNLSNLTKKLPLRSLTMQGAVSIEITEIIWICNVMGFFFKFGKQIEERFFSVVIMISHGLSKHS
jgi:predicted membrane channel-forming protein YqfA (hemolysin III family)